MLPQRHAGASEVAAWNHQVRADMEWFDRI